MPSIFGRIFFFLAGNNDNLNSLDDFEFLQEATADFIVICPWVSKINFSNIDLIMFKLANTDIRRKYKSYWINSNFGQI